VITGLSAPANSVVAIDTVLNATFASFDFNMNMYSTDYYISSPHRSASYFLQKNLAQ
jgi:hypothetical protein